MRAPLLNTSLDSLSGFVYTEFKVLYRTVIIVKRMPIGIDDFKTIHERNLYYVDKSLFIKDIIDDGAEVNLIARPRRFGKTLNLSMLRYFFEKTTDDHSYLFQSLDIWAQGHGYRQEQGKYPVIALTLKSLKAPDWATNYEILRSLLSAEFLRHRAVYDSGRLAGQDRIVFEKMMNREASDADYAVSLALLSRLLHLFHGEKVVILVDEYDTLLNEAYSRGFYEEAVGFLRVLLGEAFKNNIHLRKGVLTGIFRVAKESVFSGLNNLKVSTILQDEYRGFFGFSETEVQRILNDFQLSDKVAEVTSWYNGYRFGEERPVTIFNPWSIAQYADQQKLISYWVNTSDNLIVRQLITERSSGAVQQLVEDLLERRPIGPIRIDDTIVYREIERSPEAVWSFLLMSGYLKPVQIERRTQGLLRGLYITLAVPNEEVYGFFAEMLAAWFSDTIKGGAVEALLHALTVGDIATFSGMFRETVLHMFSYSDVGEDRAESFYHAFVLGLLVYLTDQYEVRSNRESGYGRYGVMIIPRHPGSGRKGIIIEFKKVDRYNEKSLDDALAAAIRQSEEKRYEAELHDRGVHEVVKLAIAFMGKQVKVVGSTQAGGGWKM